MKERKEHTYAVDTMDYLSLAKTSMKPISLTTRLAVTLPCNLEARIAKQAV